tara:strand:- start:4663 stop:5394 length:732 start_codon:yes stop_codon:yes gene_type:complete
MPKSKLNIITLIPARKNSKGIKNKNIINFFNMPLISYSIKISLKSNIINKTFVSTDSKKIQNISLRYKACCPFLRPAKYSKDKSTDLEVFKHFYKFYKKKYKKKIDLIVHLRPTTPLRCPILIEKLIKLMIKNNTFTSLRCFIVSENSPYKMWKKNKSTAVPFVKSKKELHSMARQTLPKIYRHIGYIDIVRPSKTIEKNSMVGNKVYFYNFNPEKYYSEDIDTNKDLFVSKKFKKKFLKYYR